MTLEELRDVKSFGQDYQELFEMYQAIDEAIAERDKLSDAFLDRAKLCAQAEKAATENFNKWGGRPASQCGDHSRT